ncbi:hypothetical protein [Pontibacter kalidii]|uniref:hypothetical protein n=1 Tax=Pontibacter kalidii TaxID=2592049 RepID=UPI0022542EEF|nr:hypothetical protein [Pontibacter kalidii]
MQVSKTKYEFPARIAFLPEVSAFLLRFGARADGPGKGIAGCAWGMRRTIFPEGSGTGAGVGK